MAISLPGLAGRPHKARLFLWRRFTRIVPLYWAAITLKVIQLTIRPSKSLNCLMTPWRVIASYLFIPAKNGAGDYFPIVVVGWTLNFEVFFYLLFAVALALDISPLAFLTPVLTAIAFLGTLRQPSWPDCAAFASPLVLEFLYGVILAHFAMRQTLPGRVWAAILLAGGFIALLLLPAVHSPLGFFGWGPPAFAIVAGAVALEDQLAPYIPKWLRDAGDASYALYLSHGFILPYLGTALARLHLHGSAAMTLAIILGLAISVPVAALVHQFIEKPLLAIFNKRRSTDREGELIPHARQFEPPLAPVSGEV